MDFSKEYRMQVCKWTGLSGIEVDHILHALEKQDIDPYSVDWETCGGDIADFSNKYQAAWDWMGRQYGYAKPVPETQIRQEEKKAKEKELDYLLSSKEGVKILLKRMYTDPTLSEKQKANLKELVLRAAPEYTTLIALYDGEEKNYAKRFLKEMVLLPKELGDLLKEDVLRIETSRGWVKSINDVPFKMRSIDLMEKITDYEPVASETVAGGTIAIYKRKEAAERLAVVPEPSRKKVEKVLEKARPKIELGKLISEKEELVKSRNEELKKWITTQFYDRDPYIRIVVDISGDLVTITAGVEGSLKLKKLKGRAADEILRPFVAKGLIREAEELKGKIFDELSRRYHLLISMGITAAGYLVERVARAEERELYTCDICGYVCSKDRAEELGYMCPSCKVPLARMG